MKDLAPRKHLRTTETAMLALRPERKSKHLSNRLDYVRSTSLPVAPLLGLLRPLRMALRSGCFPRYFRKTVPALGPPRQPADDPHRNN